MIISFAHKGLEKFYNTGSKAGIQANHASRLQYVLSLLEVALDTDSMDVSGLRLHELKGDRKETWSVSISGNWRVTFRFIGNDVELVNYEDYH